MSEANPRYFKWYPPEEIDLGTMPFEGDFSVADRIYVMTPNNLQNIYIYNSPTNEFGRYVTKKVGGRIKQVWQPGVTVTPLEEGGVNYPVWILYCGDGACALKVPAELEEVQT